MTPHGRTLPVALLLALGACSETTGLASAHLTVQLLNAGSSDRAMLLQLAGSDTSAAIDTVVAAPSAAYQLFVQRRGSNVWRVIVTGNLVNGAVVELVVPSTASAGRYAGTVLDVADSSFAELARGTRALMVAP